INNGVFEVIFRFELLFYILGLHEKEGCRERIGKRRRTRDCPKTKNMCRRFNRQRIDNVMEAVPDTPIARRSAHAHIEDIGHPDSFFDVFRVFEAYAESFICLRFVCDIASRVYGVALDAVIADDGRHDIDEIALAYGAKVEKHWLLDDQNWMLV